MKIPKLNTYTCVNLSREITSVFTQNIANHHDKRRRKKFQYIPSLYLLDPQLLKYYVVICCRKDMT